MFYLSSSDGRIYQGSWICSLKQGSGVMKFQDGTIYEVRENLAKPEHCSSLWVISTAPFRSSLQF